jgi:penicillin-binding protein 1A
MSRGWIRRSAVAVAFLVVVVAIAAIGARRGMQTARSRIHAAVEERLRSFFPEVRVGDATVGWAGDIVVGPIEIPAQAPAAPPVVRVERVILRPRLVSLLMGRAELRGVRFEEISVHAGRNAMEASALWERIRGRRSPHRESPTAVLGMAPTIEFSNLRLAAALGKREVASGPWRGTVRIVQAGAQETADPIFPEAGGLDLAVALTGDRAELSARFGGLDLAPLLGGGSGPVSLESGRMSGLVVVAGSPTSGLEADVKLDGRDIFLVGQRLSDIHVGPLRAGYEGSVRWSPNEHHLSVGPGRLALGERQEAAFRVEGDLDASSAENAFRIRVDPDALSYAQLVTALPECLRPPLPVYSLDGPIIGSLEVHGPLERRVDWELQANIDLKPLRKAVGTSDPLRMRQEFRHRVTLANGETRELRVGPGGTHFVRLEEVPEILVRAVLLSEDSGFFAHSGFDVPALWNNLIGRTDARGVIRGGSTISQQLVKNLFFGREKTYVRKFREALATMALEASVPKPRILEIYLNLIEWGPGIYGIGEAAAHYFGKAPRDLTVREAVFLATIIPNPIKYHGYCSRGALTEVWEHRMQQALEKMHSAGVLSDDQLEQGMHTTLAFVHGGRN